MFVETQGTEKRKQQTHYCKDDINIKTAKSDRENRRDDRSPHYCPARYEMEASFVCLAEPSHLNANKYDRVKLCRKDARCFMAQPPPADILFAQSWVPTTMKTNFPKSH